MSYPYIPKTDQAPVLRTDFSDEHAWKALCAEIRKPRRSIIGEFRAYVDFIDDVAFDGLSPEQVPSLVPEGMFLSYLFIVDRLALTHAEHPILVMDLDTEPGRTFRVIPAEMWAVENNLSLANMDFADFADAAGEDGIFRGFP
jgi:hypothetical protein